MPQPSCKEADQLRILSANVRGFQTNVGDLTHSFVVPNRIDVIATVETFLNDSVPKNYGQITGYTQWYRRDRISGTFGGIAVCFRKGLTLQPLDINHPDHLEFMFFKVWTSKHESILLCVCYRPQWQGSEPLHFLKDNLDDILEEHSCQHIVIVGDLNQYLVARTFEELLTVFGMCNHVDFPTHVSGSSLDPVITDFPENMVKCSALGNVGSSDHIAILTTIKTTIVYDEPITRTIWLWDKGNWQGLQNALEDTQWEIILNGDIDQQAEKLTNLLTRLQKQFIPNKNYKSKPQDLPWFGLNCRAAADTKSRAWARFKRHPTRQNKASHKSACTAMKRVQKWAIKHWQEDLSTKLRGRSVGSKEWWSCVKQQQGFRPDDNIPPLNKPDATVATGSREKAELLASHFSQKMSVEDPDRPTPILSRMTNSSLSTLNVTAVQVEQHLLKLDVNKALGPDDVSPHTLKMCASQLALPLATLYQNCLQRKTWPSVWKQARVVAIHKKGPRTTPENYRPISLLSVIGKIFEKILAAKLSKFFEDHHLLSTRQFGFMPNRSAADLLLTMATGWNKNLDSAKDTFVIALDIAGAFDRVWHKGIVAKLQSLGIDGNLLSLLQDYLQGRTLRVAVNGHSSSEHPVGASVPQGSVLGPILWNVYFDDILQLVPQAQAYADDCTLAFTCNRDNHQETVTHINATLELILAWGRRWQITLAPDKTQLMLISRTRRPTDITTNVRLGENILDPQEEIKVLGVKINKDLTFTGHVKEMAKRAAGRLTCLRRISHLLDESGRATLYKSQIRSVMEYSPLVWSSCPPSYLGLLDKVQRRAQHLLHQHTPVLLQPLQHRRDVSGLCVLYKVQRQYTPHLAPLQLPLAAPASHDTRATHNRDYQLQVPFARTELYLRSFLPHYSRLWNKMVRQTDIHRKPSMDHFKRAVNTWLYNPP